MNREALFAGGAKWGFCLVGRRGGLLRLEKLPERLGPAYVKRSGAGSLWITATHSIPQTQSPLRMLGSPGLR
jgi:hypothetical protein